MRRLQYEIAGIRFKTHWMNFDGDGNNTLTRRTKWFEDVQPIREVALVVVVDGNVRNRSQRRQQKYPVKNSIVRRADVQTSCGILQRPVVKLALINVDKESDTKATVLVTRRGEC